jgi:hypothetical protein
MFQKERTVDRLRCNYCLDATFTLPNQRVRLGFLMLFQWELGNRRPVRIHDSHAPIRKPVCEHTLGSKLAGESLRALTGSVDVQEIEPALWKSGEVI